MKTVVRPPTARTRRKEIKVKHRCPVEIFIDLMQPLETGEVAGFEWIDTAKTQLKPTRETAALEEYKYVLSKPSVVDRVWRLQDLDVKRKGPYRRGYGCSRLHMSRAAEQRGEKTDLLAQVTGNVKIAFKVPKNRQQPSDAHIGDAIESVNARQERPHNLGDDVRTCNRCGPSQADEAPLTTDDRRSRVSHVDNCDGRGGRVLSRKRVASTATADRLARVTKQLGATKDKLQIAEMRLSEEIHAHSIDVQDLNRMRSDNTVWRRKVELAVASEMEAIVENEKRMRWELRLAERETRSIAFQNLNLQRRLALMSDVVPKVEFEGMRDRLSSEIAAQAERIAALHEQLALHEHGEEDVLAQQPKRNRPVDRLRQSVGLRADRQVPHRQFKGDPEKRTAVESWKKVSVAHITAVLRDRPIEHIMLALRRVGLLAHVLSCPLIMPLLKGVIQTVIDAFTARWTARLSLHIWDRLQLSTRKMDDLRHLLSFTYDPVSNTNQRIRVWENPDDPADYICMPCLVGRDGREKLFQSIAEQGEISVGENGRCERDAYRCVKQMYCNFSAAMRTDFSSSRPARPILYFDGTGASLGKGITHAEIGSADFIGDCKQSRETVTPLALYAGNDHALPLRSNLAYSMDTFNRLSSYGQIDFDDESSIPIEPIIVGDMQGVKCIMGMTESCHSVWCKCRAHEAVEGEGSQHKYGDRGSNFSSYDDMIHFYDSIGCEFKSEDFMLACAHLSKGVFYGNEFTPFTCPECGHSPSAAQSRAEQSRSNAMTDEEQAAERKEHVKGGQHYHVEKFMGPMAKGFGMRRCGVDLLHLAYLNMFKHLFKYTIHEPLPDSKKKMVRDYLKQLGYYSYDASDDSDDPVKRWIGREVKRFMHEADAQAHLPFLLSVGSSHIDINDDVPVNDEGEEEMEIEDDEFEPTHEEVQQEMTEDPLLVQSAERWDTFLDWIREIETPWTCDTDEYRKERALRFCNKARAVARDLIELKPTLASWVPHIACNIVPRQMVQFGDPTRWSADACESYGACCKKIVKTLTCHRKMCAKYKRGYIEQCFRRCVVRYELRHGEENEAYLLRRDHVLRNTGRISTASSKVEGPHMSVRVKVEQESALS